MLPPARVLARCSIARIKLEGVGPKMLISQESTGDSEFLHWRFELRGNNAVEFGVIPEYLQDQPKALHKCQTGKGNDRPFGMCSSITVGSMLPVRIPLMKVRTRGVLSLLGSRKEWNSWE